jgi:hypothetical protein
LQPVALSVRVGSNSLSSVFDTETSWFPAIGRRLSGAWIDASVTATKAAKWDDGCVPSHLWDARIFPHSLPVLSVLRQWLLQLTRRRLWREFRTNYVLVMLPSGVPCC